tara:strand:- start:413 stop:685 length:273 start_codon:yes stop_codon:yes gene_type:complete
MGISELKDLDLEVQGQTCVDNKESIISFQTKLPMALKTAMKKYIEAYPNWDQYRLVQAALAGFLVQNGVDSRTMTRLYIGNMFNPNSSNK